MNELIELLRKRAADHGGDKLLEAAAAAALEARAADEVDGDTIAEVVAYLNGHKTAPAKHMADAVLRLLIRYYQAAAALARAQGSMHTKQELSK